MTFFKKIFIVVALVSMQTSLFAEVHDVDDAASLQEAIRNLNSGDTINLSANEYNLSERLVISGKEHITIKGKGAKQTIIDGANVKNTVKDKGEDGVWRPTTWAGLFEIVDSKHIVIQGLQLRSSNFAGFFIHDGSENIIIQDNMTQNTYSSGIGVWGSEYIYIYDNEVSKACNGGGQESITVSNSSDVEVVRNNVHNNGYTELNSENFGGEGIDIKENSSYVIVADNHVHDLRDRTGIYVDAYNSDAHHISVFNNVVHDIKNHTGIALACEQKGSLANILIYNNLVYKNDGGGIEVAGYGTGKSEMKKISIINNTLYKNTNGGIIVSNNNANKIKITNNILSENSTGKPADTWPYQLYITDNKNDHELIINNDLIEAREISITNNLVEINEGVDYLWAYHDNNILGNPAFMNPELADFHLQSASPAINAGINTSEVTFDLDGVERPVNGITDIGAYEFND
jgi:hypothetical protein